MRNFQDTFETRKCSFISAFSICMAVPLNLENNFCLSENRLQFTIYVSWSFITPCLSASAQSTPESLAMKIRLVKPLPGEKDSDFPPPQSILHNLVHLGENAE